MNESYLHFLWEMRYLPSTVLELTDKTEFRILKFGTYNKNESGPDFLEASLEINSVILHGNIEFHLKSSDWYLHNHHLDPAYNNVILHVVWQHDSEVVQNGFHLPTLLLSEFINEETIIHLGHNK
ncbi:MAG: DUF2851 family protein, partial [Bacteroidetes bacterium]|nr:DUF2851 family protein [Bacteroidota bacterium]